MTSNVQHVPRIVLQSKAASERSLAGYYAARSAEYIGMSTEQPDQTAKWYNRVEAMQAAQRADMHLYTAEAIESLLADPLAVQTYNPGPHGPMPPVPEEGPNDVPGWGGAGASVEAQRG
jgi:hypothetical protein